MMKHLEYSIYIKQRWLDAETLNGANIQGIEPVYDAWRKEVISYLLDIPNPQLTPINQ
ncbi:hypothetical protein [Scytonema sp. NUACC26]|uniref:hypothetical protein n=1 Tax=Scytonema sp. NUACC26 TaxID=3140176 RepID=UPI0034DBF5E9